MCVWMSVCVCMFVCVCARVFVCACCTLTALGGRARHTLVLLIHNLTKTHARELPAHAMHTYVHIHIHTHARARTHPPTHKHANSHTLELIVGGLELLDLLEARVPPNADVPISASCVLVRVPSNIFRSVRVRVWARAHVRVRVCVCVSRRKGGGGGGGGG